MANPTTRQGLIDYCLRRLGEPVIEINVDPDQLEDRVDEAIQYWQEFHADATYRTYVAHLVGEGACPRKAVNRSESNRTVGVDRRRAIGST